MYLVFVDMAALAFAILPRPIAAYMVFKMVIRLIFKTSSIHLKALALDNFPLVPKYMYLHKTLLKTVDTIGNYRYSK